MLFESQSAVLARLIADGRGVHDAAGFETLKSEAEAWKPGDYDAHQVALRQQYEGNIAPHLQSFARLRFPNTGSRMPLVPFNWAALFANNGAAVYDYAPSRYLERDGKRIDATLADGEEDRASPGDRQRAAEFSAMVKEAHLEVVMAEAERRLVLAKTIFLRVHSDSIEAVATGRPPRTVVQPFWPSDVLIIPHPRCPASLTTAIALMARVSDDGGVNGQGKTWEVWTRSYVEDDEGMVASFGQWRCELVAEKKVVRRGLMGRESIETEVTIKPMRFTGSDGVTSEFWPLTSLPWIAWHHGVADGCPFLDVDRNLVQLFDTINASMMSETFAVDMNAAAVLVRKSDQISTGSIILGPGAMPTIKETESIESIAMGADFAGMRASNNALVATLAMTSRQSASDYDASQSVTVSSGVALKIRNEPQAKARLEAIARAREVESRLLRVMIEVHDHWRATSIADEGIVPCMEPRDPPEYEDAEVTQRRAIDARDAGIISEARAAVLAGYYRTEEEAQVAIDKIRSARALRVSPLRQEIDAIATRPASSLRARPDASEDEPDASEDEPDPSEE